jgi:hypothetical protein
MHGFFANSLVSLATSREGIGIEWAGMNNVHEESLECVPA